jgi:putative glutamine amidotransferase
MTPRIAIPIPTSIDLAYNQRSWPNYAAAVERSGGEPVAIDLASTPAKVRELAATCNGFLLPGSPADVSPALYGADRDPDCGPEDSARDAADRLLLDHAAATRKPVLGICFGIQSLNVWAGGTLVQDLTPVPVNHSAGSSVAIAHTALIARHTLLGEILSGTEAVDDPSSAFLRLPINTSHHQSVASPGDDLRIVARSPEDGVVEAVELPFEGPHPHFLLGVQWHPERSYDISAASRALFARLIAEARKPA